MTNGIHSQFSMLVGKQEVKTACPTIRVKGKRPRKVTCVELQKNRLADPASVGRPRKMTRLVTPRKRVQSSVGVGKSLIGNMVKERNRGVFANVFINKGSWVCGADYSGVFKVFQE